MTEKKQVDEHIAPPDDQEWKKQVQMMNVFDALVYNTDRNRGNILITPDWRLWMIDHTRAFRQLSTLWAGDTIKQCERGVYEKLKALDEKEVRERLKPYLSSFEIGALLDRRKLLVQQIDKLIAENGEDKVLYRFVFVPTHRRPPRPRPRRPRRSRPRLNGPKGGLRRAALSRSSSSSASMHASTWLRNSLRPSAPTAENPQAFSHGSSHSTRAAASSPAVGVLPPSASGWRRSAHRARTVGSRSDTSDRRRSRSTLISKNSSA